jgi:hypothetical protein
LHVVVGPAAEWNTFMRQVRDALEQIHELKVELFGAFFEFRDAVAYGSYAGLQVCGVLAGFLARTDVFGALVALGLELFNFSESFAAAGIDGSQGLFV